MSVELGAVQSFLQLYSISPLVGHKGESDQDLDPPSWNLPEEAMGTSVKSRKSSLLGRKSHSYRFIAIHSPGKCFKVLGALFFMQSRGNTN